MYELNVLNVFVTRCRIKDDGTKVRFLKKTGEEIPDSKRSKFDKKGTDGGDKLKK